MRRARGTCRHVPATAPDFGAPALGKQHRFPPIIPTYVHALANDRVFSLPAARRRDPGKRCGYYGGASVARDRGLSRRNRQVAFVNAGKSPITEPGLDEPVERAVRKGLLSAAKDASRYLDSCAIAMVCMGATSASDRSRNLSFVVEAFFQNRGCRSRRRDPSRSGCSWH
jgi:hypothetical protein